MTEHDLKEISLLAVHGGVTITLRPDGFHLLRRTATQEAVCVIPYSLAFAAFYPTIMFERQIRSLQ